MPLLVSLTRKRVIYLALELDRSWTELFGVYLPGICKRFKKANGDVTEEPDGSPEQCICLSKRRGSPTTHNRKKR